MEEVIESLQSLFIHPGRLALSSHEVIGKSQFEVRAALLDKQHDVAVKLIPFSSITDDERLMLSLKKEVLAMKECESEFVVQLIGVCLWEREIGIVMERMFNSLRVFAYGSLRGTLSYGQLVQVALKIAQGLGFLHSKGFVHRDVKPENILVNSDASAVKWTDFGLASALLTSVVATKTNVGAGTPHFMSPEQTDSDAVVTRATDVWSLGCVLLSLLSGETPWPVEMSPMQIGIAMLVKRKTPTVPDSIPAEMQTLLRRCLTWEAQDRPTASQVVSMLRDIASTSKYQMPTQVTRTTSSVFAQAQQTATPATVVDHSTESYPVDSFIVSFSVRHSDAYSATVGASLYQSAQNHIYEHGACAKDDRKGAELLKQAAEMGHPRAMFEWGMCVREGLHYVKMDEYEGKQLIMKAAEAGDQLAKDFYEVLKFSDKSNRLYDSLQSMDKSDPWVMYFLGLAYEWNYGVSQDTETAVQWYQRAADAGHILSLYTLGCCYQNGVGGLHDEPRGFALCKLAADQGYANAMDRVGYCYKEGVNGVAKDVNKAIEYYKLAQAQGANCTEQLQGLGA